MRVTNVCKSKCPMFMGLVSEVLRFAGYGEDFSARSTNLVDNTLFYIAP